MEFIDLILVSQVDRVLMHACPYKLPVDGTLCITGHHLILSSRKKGTDELLLLHQNIDVVERKPANAGGGSLILKCKDFRIIKLDIESTDDLNNVATSLDSIISVNNILLMYPFFYRTPTKPKEDGWYTYKMQTRRNQLCDISDSWRTTYVNKNYEVCNSYPTTLTVPSQVTDAMLISASKFREGGRFPVLSYLHTNGAALMRSSQPMVGNSKRRCKEDEKLLNAVLGPGKRGFIVDTRSQAIAQNAMKNGHGGYEMEIHYPQWRRTHNPIERYQTLLDSLSKLVDACNDKASSMDRWSSRLESSNWLSHIKDALNCACLVAQCLDREGSSVLVHGNEGTDSTLVATSITQIILDSECRTISGFQSLIEREWLMAGHPFQLRYSRGCYSSNGTGRNKVHGATFLLFLDCVYQIQTQFSCSFEFLPSFLIAIFEHSCSSEFGTFLGNCEADKEMLELPQKTTSLWSYFSIPEVIKEHINPMYVSSDKIIWPSVAPMSIVLWRELYLRWAIDLSHIYEMWDRVKKIFEKDKALTEKCLKLRKQLFDLEVEAAEVGLIRNPVERI